MTSAEMNDTSMAEIDDEQSVMNGLDLFWKNVVKPNEPLMVAPIEDYFVRITNASLGPDVQKNTRTCLTVVQASDEDTDAPGVVCTLKNTYENHQLNLLVSDDIQFSVAGENTSPIYLVGYLTPAEKHASENPFDMDDDLEEADEMTEEELNEMDNKTKQKLLAGRKRKLNEMEKDTLGGLEAENEEKPLSAQKKTKNYKRKS